MTIYTNAIGGDHQGPTYIVAASNSLHPERADYVCDGVDDQVEIQAAIDAMVIGGRLQFLDGIYNTTSVTNVTKPVTLVGSGLAEFDGGTTSPSLSTYTPVGGTQLYIADNSNCDLLSIQNSGVTLDSLVLNGNRGNQTSGNLVHYTAASPEHVEFNIINCQLLNAKESGVYDEGWRGSITNSFVGGCDIGIKMGISGHLHFNTFNSHILHNRIGIYSPVYTTSQRHWMCCENSVAYNAEDGINVGMQASTISENIIFSNGNTGLYINNTIGVVTRHKILGNTIEKNQNDGLRIMSLTSVIGNEIYDNTYNGILVDGRGNYIMGNYIMFNDRNDTNTYDGIRLSADTAAGGRNNVIVSNEIMQNDRYDIYSADAVNYIFTNYIGSDSINSPGSGLVIRGNVNYITENSGTDTIAAAQTSKVVTHGLAVTPAAGDIMVTPMESLGNASFFWVDTYTSTQFTIHVNAAPGANTDFAWKAIVL